MSRLLRNQSFQAGLALLLGVAIAGAPLMAMAQQYNPPRRGIPGRREGAGTRSPNGRCIQGQKPFTVLAPTDNVGSSTSQTPKLFWYVPVTVAKTAEFRLLSSTDQEIYTTTVALNGVPGVVSLQIPGEVTARMEPGKDYRWQFSLNCTPGDPSKNPFLEGIVQRVEANSALMDALTLATTARDRASVYASAGIWQDAIATLAEQRCAQPNDRTLRTSWNTLLKSVELEKFAQEPLTPSCPASPDPSPVN